MLLRWGLLGYILILTDKIYRFLYYLVRYLFNFIC